MSDIIKKLDDYAEQEADRRFANDRIKAIKIIRGNALLRRMKFAFHPESNDRGGLEWILDARSNWVYNGNDMLPGVKQAYLAEVNRELSDSMIKLFSQYEEYQGDIKSKIESLSWLIAEAGKDHNDIGKDIGEALGMLEAYTHRIKDAEQRIAGIEEQLNKAVQVDLSAIPDTNDGVQSEPATPSAEFIDTKTFHPADCKPWDRIGTETDKEIGHDELDDWFDDQI
jgi:hypothetical protein